MADPATINSFADLTALPYKNQAVWFLNGFWSEFDDGSKVGNETYDLLEKFVDLDPNGKEGKELDEFNAHRILEMHDQTLSAIKMREALRTIDLDSNNKMALIEFLVWQHKKTPEATVNAPQGENQEAMAAAEQKMAEVQAALDDLQPKLEAATQAFNIVKAAEDEVAAAVAELKAQEEAYAAKVAELERKSTDTSTGIVTRNKAAAELAQLKAEDPLPLRKAKITQEAALRKAEKARVAAEEPKRRLEEAYAELESKMQEAVDELEQAKRAGGRAHGALFWMERDLFEADKSLPRAKQRYDHAKGFTYSED